MAKTKPAPRKPAAARSGRTAAKPDRRKPADTPVPEIGGRDGPDPTRYGDWEYKGRCIDF